MHSLVGVGDLGDSVPEPNDVHARVRVPDRTHKARSRLMSVPEVLHQEEYKLIPRAHPEVAHGPWQNHPRSSQMQAKTKPSGPRGRREHQLDASLKSSTRVTKRANQVMSRSTEPANTSSNNSQPADRSGGQFIVKPRPSPYALAGPNLHEDRAAALNRAPCLPPPSPIELPKAIRVPVHSLVTEPQQKVLNPPRDEVKRGSSISSTLRRSGSLHRRGPMAGPRPARPRGILLPPSKRRAHQTPVTPSPPSRTVRTTALKRHVTRTRVGMVPMRAPSVQSSTSTKRPRLSRHDSGSSGTSSVVASSPSSQRESASHTHREAPPSDADSSLDSQWLSESQERPMSPSVAAERQERTSVSTAASSTPPVTPPDAHASLPVIANADHYYGVPRRALPPDVAAIAAKYPNWQPAFSIICPASESSAPGRRLSSQTEARAQAAQQCEDKLSSRAKREQPLVLESEPNKCTLDIPHQGNKAQETWKKLAEMGLNFSPLQDFDRAQNLASPTSSQAFTPARSSSGSSSPSSILSVDPDRFPSSWPISPSLMQTYDPLWNETTPVFTRRESSSSISTATNSNSDTCFSGPREAILARLAERRKCPSNSPPHPVFSDGNARDLHPDIHLSIMTLRSIM